MLAKLKQKIILVGFLSIFLLVSMLTIIVFNIIILDGKYNEEVLQLNESGKLLMENKDQKHRKNIPLFHLLEHVSDVSNVINSGDGINVYITYFNQHIVAINSFNMSQKLLAGEATGNVSAVKLVAMVISEQLDELRSHALGYPKLLKSYQDRYIKRSVILLKNISTSTVSPSERRVILDKSYHSLLGQAQTITDKMIVVLIKDKKVVLSFLYGALIFCLLVLLVQIKIIRSLISGSKEFTEKVLFIRDYLQENNGSDHHSYSDSQPVEYLFNEAKILVGMLSKKNIVIKNLHEKIKNSHSLASLLGYEINAMTSIIAGGLALNHKDDAQETTFDHEIYGSLTSLENLSDNFNHLFSEKDQEIDLDQVFNIRDQLNKMFVLLDYKCRALNKEFDFVIEDSVPEFACGNAYRFYWCLHNIFVRGIEDGEQRYCLLHISAAEGTNLENKTLHINLFSTSGKYLSLSSFLESMKHIDVDNALVNMNMQLYDRIVHSFFNGGVSFKETDSGDSNIVINIIITPTKYEKQEQEQEKLIKVLIYAKVGLQTSIILKKLAQAGANVVHCENDFELFKLVSTDDTFDFVFISEDWLRNGKLAEAVKTKTSAKLMLLSNFSDKTKIIDSPFEAIIKLPLYQSKLQAVLSGKEETPSDDEQVKKVLIVDDDPAQQFILSHFLKRIGLVSTFANDGDSALTLIKDNAFDLVFMDCIMPGKDGFETTVLIREYENILKLNGKLENEITIIGNTSLTGECEFEKCIQSGMNTVLTKPYKHKKILELLAKLG